jgi:hypothetical protein
MEMGKKSVISMIVKDAVEKDTIVPMSQNVLVVMAMDNALEISMIAVFAMERATLLEVSRIIMQKYNDIYFFSAYNL